MKILIVDDEHVALKSFRRILKRKGLRDCELCDNGKDAIRLLEDGHYDVVLLDIIMPDMDGLEVLEKAAPRNPRTEFIMLTALDEASHAVRAIKLGAYDYLVKPVDNNRLILTIEHAFERMGMKAGLGAALAFKGKTSVPDCFKAVVTRSSRMIELLVYAGIMARSDSPIMISGESGTGKELIARGIHMASPRAKDPFVPVNVTAIPESLFESHFFGHVKGAFTGAENDHAGYFEQAHGGTLFLDEVGVLPTSLQPKLLRVLEDNTFTRVGDIKSRQVDVRLVSATNMDLEKACNDQKFRLDLFFRLRAAHIALPPLQERPGDIPLLADHFVREAAGDSEHGCRGISPEAMLLLTTRPYPGNIRELRNVVRTAVVLCQGGIIQPHHVTTDSMTLESFARPLCGLKENEEIHVVHVLQQFKGDRKDAARILGISIRQLQRKVAALREDPKWRDKLDGI